ncbi:MAG: ATP-binding protein [Bacteroidota bacterium]|nr:ATP-binding protein [Bacteroidota bacterium]
MKDLSLHILDIVQNSITANASFIEISIEESHKANKYILKIKDNGKGMSPEMAEKVTDPYVTSRTTRKVGLGLPLLKMNAERTGGQLEIISEEGKGTEVVAVFILNNIDRLPLGDIAGTIVLLASANPTIEFVYSHIVDGERYIFDTREVKEALNEVSINDIHIFKYLKEMINENLDEIKATK